MRRLAGYIWIRSLLDKIESKHGVSVDEICQVFENDPLYRLRERGRFQGEDMYSASGQTDAGTYLVVFFIWKKNGDVLPVTAYQMSDKMKRSYAKIRPNK